eukprot:scaffold237128_cov28-Attheya_sp.AAC.1
MIFCFNGCGAPMVSVENSEIQCTTTSRTLDFSRIIQKATTSACAVISRWICTGSLLNNVCARLISREMVLVGSCSCCCTAKTTVLFVPFWLGCEATETIETRCCAMYSAVGVVNTDCLDGEAIVVCTASGTLGIPPWAGTAGSAGVAIVGCCVTGTAAVGRGPTGIPLVITVMILYFFSDFVAFATLWLLDTLRRRCQLSNHRLAWVRAVS